MGMTPLEHFIRGLRSRTVQADPDSSYGSHTHTSESNYASDEEIECETKCDSSLTLPAPLASTSMLADLPLSVFATHSLIFRVWAEVLGEEIWFASAEAQVQALQSRGIPRKNIFSAQELMDLLKLFAADKEKAWMVYEAKKLFGGSVRLEKAP